MAHILNNLVSRRVKARHEDSRPFEVFLSLQMFCIQQEVPLPEGDTPVYTEKFKKGRLF